MSDVTTPERETRSRVNQIEEAKREARRQISEAISKAAEDDPELLKRIKEKLLADFAEAIEEASQARREKPSEDKKRQVDEKKAISTVRVLEGIKAGIIKTSSNSGAVFSRLADQRFDVDSSAALAELINKYSAQEITISSSNQPKSEFEQDLGQLEQDHPEAANQLKRALIVTAHEQGGITGQSEQEIRERFIVRSERENVPTEPKQAQEFNESDAIRLNQFEKRIGESDLPFTQREQLISSLTKGMVGEVEMNTLQEIGFGPDEVKELIYLAARSREQQSRKGNYDQFFPPEEREKFTVRYLLENNYLVPGEGLTEKGRRMLKRTALKTVNALFKRVDAQPDSEFQKGFSEFHEGYIFRYIQDVILALRDDPALAQAAGSKASAVTEFIQKGVFEEISRERELRELFHDVGIWIKTATPEDLTKYMARYNLSVTTSPVMSDISGNLVGLAMSEYERYLKFDIAANSGKIRPGLFAGKVNPNLLYYEVEDREKLKARVQAALAGLKKYAASLTPEDRAVFQRQQLRRWDLENLEEYDETWEIDRAIKYARGIELTQTIRGFEIIASSRPPLSYEGSADNFYDMAAFINPNFKWRTGRGGSGIRETHIPEILGSEGIVRRPETNFFKRIWKDKWNPKKIHEHIQAWSDVEMSERWADIKDSWLYRDMQFRQLLNKFGLGGLASRSSWRMVGFKGGTFQQDIAKIQGRIQDSVQEALPDGFTFGQDWVQTYEKLTQVVGVGTRFWFDGVRATDLVKDLLWQHLGIRERIDAGEIGARELDKLWFEYTEGKQGDREIFPLSDGEKYTVTDMLEARTLVLRGLNFFDLLKRSPMDFLNNIVNLTPELLTEGFGGKSDLWFEVGTEQEIEARVRQAGIKKDQIKKTAGDIIAFQNSLRRIWGTENFDHLKRIRGFYRQLEEWGKKQSEDGKTFDKGKTLENFYGIMDLAVERVRLRNGSVMKKEDISDPVLQEMFFGDQGKKGLITYFTDLNEDFGKAEGGRDKTLGENGFFYHMARGWYNDLGHSLHPDSSDVDWRYVFHRLGQDGGENMVKRLWGDLTSWNEVTKSLMDLDHMLFAAGHAHSLEKIMELHGKIHTLEAYAGKTAVYEMQYYLAQIVARYFQEHHAARQPFLLGTIGRILKGKEVSLSRIYGGLGAMTLTTDGINAYFQELAHSGIIPEEGIWGFKKLSQALGADWQKLVVTEMLPNIATALFLFLMWKYINDALKASGGGGKKK